MQDDILNRAKEILKKRHDELYYNAIKAMMKYQKQEQMKLERTRNHMGPYFKINTLQIRCDSTVSDPLMLTPPFVQGNFIINNLKSEDEVDYIKDQFEDDINVLLNYNISNKPYKVPKLGQTRSSSDEISICMDIDRVIFNAPATIILWQSYHFEDIPDKKDPMIIHHIQVQDKTVVKCAPGEKFNRYNGFCAAVTKRIFETNSAINRIIRNAQDELQITPEKNSNKKPIKKAMKKLEKEFKKK